MTDMPDFMRAFFDNAVPLESPDCAAFEHALQEMREAFADTTVEHDLVTLQNRLRTLMERADRDIFNGAGLKRGNLVEMTLTALLLLARKYKRKT